MQSTPVGALFDLCLAAKPVGNNQISVAGLAYLRQQDSLTAFNGNVVLRPFFKAKGAGHPAAAGFERLYVQSHRFEQLLLGRHAHHRLVMAVAVKQSVTVQLWDAEVGSISAQKLRQREGLFVESFGIDIVWVQVQ